MRERSSSHGIRPSYMVVAVAHGYNDGRMKEACCLVVGWL